MSELLLLSGGIDSICIAAWHKPTLALTVDYGQVSAQAEIKAAQKVCYELGIQHEVIHADISNLGAGAMSYNAKSPLSNEQSYWPFRNQFLLTLALMLAAQTNNKLVCIGSLKTDHHYSDGTERFIQIISSLSRHQEGEIDIVAPAIRLTALELVNVSKVPMAILGWAHSCHISNLACGRCPGCIKQSRLFGSLNILR